MKFKELDPESAYRARKALATSIIQLPSGGKERFEMLAEGIAAAFIKLEHFDGAPDECGGRSTNSEHKEVRDEDP